MIRFVFLAAPLLAISAIGLHAAPASAPAPATTVASVPTANMVPGTWVTTEKRKDGRILTAKYEIKGDGKFKGWVELDDKPFWTYSGTWSFKDGDITWNYLESSKKLKDNAKTDVDEVLSLTSDTMVLRSRMTRQSHTFQRKK